MAKQRLNVTFSPSARTTLEDLAEQKGKSLSDVLTDAILLEKWITDARDQGGKLLIQDSDGQVREVLIR